MHAEEQKRFQKPTTSIPGVIDSVLTTHSPFSFHTQHYNILIYSLSLSYPITK